MKYLKNLKLALMVSATVALASSAMANSNKTPLPNHLATPAMANVGHTTLSTGHALGENLSYQFKRGVYHYGVGDYDSASKAFGRVLRANAYDPMSNYYYGLSKQQQGNHKKAIKHLTLIHKYYQNSPQVHVALGRSLIAEGRQDDALDLLGNLEAMERACKQTCAQHGEIVTAKHILQDKLYTH